MKGDWLVAVSDRVVTSSDCEKIESQASLPSCRLAMCRYTAKGTDKEGGASTPAASAPQALQTVRAPRLISQFTQGEISG